jgi:hypothetical protein
MNSRQTETITRVDVRIPNYIYEQVVAIATRHFHAKVHHRSGKPEVSPTILELIKIGIAHLESTLPDTADISDKSVASELREQIQDLDLRLRAIEQRSLAKPIENKLSDDLTDTSDTADESLLGMNRATLAPIFEEVDNESDTVSDKQRLSDRQLAEVLGVSSTVISRCRVEGKKPRQRKIAAQLEAWQVKGDRWMKKY